MTQPISISVNGCTCPLTPGVPADSHTSGVDPSIDDNVLAVLIDMEGCPVEKRALVRILANRQAHL